MTEYNDEDFDYAYSLYQEMLLEQEREEYYEQLLKEEREQFYGDLQEEYELDCRDRARDMNKEL